MARKPSAGSPTIQFLRDRYIGVDPEMIALYEEEQINAEVARKVYDLREQAGLTRKELASRVGTKADVIQSLEEADCDGHSVAWLRRIAAALEKRVEIRVVARKSSRHGTAPPGAAKGP